MKPIYFHLISASLLAVGLTLSTTSNSAVQAATLSFDLNCVISGNLNSTSYSGNSCDSVNTSFGTLTFTDTTYNGKNAVALSLDLTGTANKIHSIGLNYNDDLFNNSSPFRLSTKAISVREDNTSAGPYTGLDLLIANSLRNGSATGTLNATDKFNTIIYLNNQNLSVNDLNFSAGASDIYAAVHIGNYGNAPGTTGGNSVWVGARKIPVHQDVPEPGISAALALFGLTSLCFLKRKNKGKF